MNRPEDQPDAEKGMGFLLNTKGAAMWHHSWKINKNKKGQNLIEYAMVASVVAAAVFAMSTYVFRSVQATQQKIQTEFRNE